MQGKKIIPMLSCPIDMLHVLLVRKVDAATLRRYFTATNRQLVLVNNSKHLHVRGAITNPLPSKLSLKMLSRRNRSKF